METFRSQLMMNLIINYNIILVEFEIETLFWLRRGSESESESGSKLS